MFTSSVTIKKTWTKLHPSLLEVLHYPVQQKKWVKPTSLKHVGINSTYLCCTS